jgi:hypothetical protein
MPGNLTDWRIPEPAVYASADILVNRMYSHMVLTFYLGMAALEFKQYAAYVQRRTATRAASSEPCDPAADSTGAEGFRNSQGPVPVAGVSEIQRFFAISAIQFPYLIS